MGAILRFVLLPMLGIAALSWWLIGDRSTVGTDYLVQVPVLQDHPARVGVFGIVLLGAVAVDLAWTRPVPPRRYAVGVLPPVLLGGIGAAYGGRLITAHVHGANIGGGMAILFGPIPLIGVIAWASAVLVSSRKTAPAA